MTTALATQDAIDPAVIAQVILHGDLSKLTASQKVSYYTGVCKSLGLNPLTKPFQYLTLSGKELLYASRDATDQLRKLHAVSVQITAREVVEDCYVVTARAQLGDRHDESIGAVPIGGLRGENRANAMMKAETKAKRRVTLAICGLGMLDETEVASLTLVEAPAPEPAHVHTLGNSDLVMVPDYPTGRPLITEGQRRKLFAAAAAKGWDREQFRSWLAGQGVESTTKIAQADLDAILQMIKDAHAAPQPDESDIEPPA
jgi:hypothetical protein